MYIGTMAQVAKKHLLVDVCGCEPEVVGKCCEVDSRLVDCGATGSCDDVSGGAADDCTGLA